MNILFRVISPKNIFDVCFLQKCQIFIFFDLNCCLSGYTFQHFQQLQSFFFFYELKITQYFAKMPNLNTSENNPVNNLERCKVMLWEVNKRVEWFFWETIWRISTCQPLEAILYKASSQLVWSDLARHINFNKHVWPDQNKTRFFFLSSFQTYNNLYIFIFVKYLPLLFLKK